MDTLNQEQLASQYGFALAFMKSNHELWNLFSQATAHTWTPDLFIAKLRDTKWFKTHSANVRNAILQKTSDPATYKANVDQMYSTVRDAWGQMFGTAQLNDSHLKQWAETAHMMGWSQAQLVDHMTQGLNYQKLIKSHDLGGTAAQVNGELDKLQNDYGIQFGSKWKADQMSKVLNGDDTMAGVTDRMRELAKREYAAFADQIDGGATVNDIVEPYRQQMASLLEMNPQDIGVQDKMIQRALKQRTPDGKPAALSMSDFADMVRKDNRWQYTDNARQDVANTLQTLGQAWGVLA